MITLTFTVSVAFIVGDHGNFYPLFCKLLCSISVVTVVVVFCRFCRYCCFRRYSYHCRYHRDTCSDYHHNYCCCFCCCCDSLWEFFALDHTPNKISPAPRNPWGPNPSPRKRYEKKATNKKEKKNEQILMILGIILCK